MSSGKNEIDSFEVHSNGDVVIVEAYRGTRTEHKYWNVPKKLALKLLQSSSAPSVSEFESWVKEDRDKREKTNADSVDCCSWGWWSKNA